MQDNQIKHGPVSWMAKNHVAANIVMIILLFGGLFFSTKVKQEVFPEFSLDIISITVPYPGASPKEVEQGVLLALEEAISTVDGVKKINTTAHEGLGVAMVELLLGYNPDKVLSNVKTAVDRINSFPKNIEKPNMSLAANKAQAISLVIYGDVSIKNLHYFAEKARRDLLKNDKITDVQISGVKDPEISIEVSQQTLDRYNLTLDKVARAISMTSLEVPAGVIKTLAGEIGIRTNDRRYSASDFANIVIKSDAKGALVKLSDIATINDGFVESDMQASFNGQPAVMVNIFRVGNQTPIEIANIVKQYRNSLAKQLPEKIQVSIWNNYAKYFEERVDLLLRNAAIGLILVFILLSIFLEARLAFWVMLGIPASFLGSFLLMPFFGASINMMSLFAYILTLGMVVDDAIVVGESIYRYRSEGKGPLQAAILGARKMAIPISFAILTTIVAFMPMFFVPGATGKIFSIIPAVVVSVLAISLLESIFILPAHLSWIKEKKQKGFWLILHNKQQKFSQEFINFVNNIYGPFVEKAVKLRYITLSSCLAMIIATFGLVYSGWISFTFLPNIDSDLIIASINYPVGTSARETIKLEKYLVKQAKKVLRKNGGENKAVGIYSQIATSLPTQGPMPQLAGDVGGHTANVLILLTSSDKRNFSGQQFANDWRKEVGEIPFVKSLTFRSTLGPGAESNLELQISHNNTEILDKASAEILDILRNFDGLASIDSTISQGKEQITFSINDNGRKLGLSPAQIGQQIRHAFFGAEAIRQQKGRDELKIMVRLPKHERVSINNLENLIIRLNSTAKVPLLEVADINYGQSYSNIKRENGQRIVTIKANIIDEITNVNIVKSTLNNKYIDKIKEKYPGIALSFEGEQRQQDESLQSLFIGFVLSLLVIYALLAIPFKSYLQPLIVMSAIPFGAVGAIFGHVFMGYGLSLISVMGLIALAGIVVNDSLVFVYTANSNIKSDNNYFHAVITAGKIRFRPILLTSLTTFFGLAPMIFETSMQAKFLIPMAISLGFGVLFATFIILILVPSLYMIINDIKKMFV